MPIETDAIVLALERLRARKPLVHCLTNQVVKAFTANALLAIGAAPAMVEDPDEAAEFAGIADALLVNVGTLDQVQMTAIWRAILSANAAGKPWILDPVAVGPLSLRTHFVREILPLKPAIIRGNASEILTLAGENGGGRGPESSAGSDAARDAAKHLAVQSGAVVLVTGKTDYISSPSPLQKTIAASNGHEMLTRITGAGCAMGAITAAFAAVTDAFTASASVAIIFGLAGELAAAQTLRPGSFAVALLDALDQIDGEIVRAKAALSGE